MEIVLATHNLHKLLEFKDLFKSLNWIELISLHQFSDYIPSEETGKTFKENAILKAEHAAKTLNCLALADDSGLVVPALQGQPGVKSRRYAGPQATDKQNCDKLLASMHSFEDADRTAYYEICLALASPTELLKTVEARCEGRIIASPKGNKGFGYDPLFIKDGYNETFGELGSIKNRLSHRYKAFERLRIFLEKLKKT